MISIAFVLCFIGVGVAWGIFASLLLRLIDRNEMRCRVIVVEGIIGAGKTSYINMIVQKLQKDGKKVVHVQEPVDTWKDILPLFYADKKRWSYHFQTRAFFDRIKANIEAYKKYKNNCDVYILERSPLSDPLFMELLYSDGDVTQMEMKDYYSWGRMWYKLMPYEPNAFIYLRPTLDTCMSRVVLRSRNGEADISRDYQEKLLDKHDKFFGSKFVMIKNKRVPVHLIKTDVDFKNNKEAQEELYNNFLTFLE